MSEITMDSTMKPFLNALLGVPFSSTKLSGLKTTTEAATQADIETQKPTDLEIHRSNFMWTEDPADELPVNFPRFYNHYENRRLHMSALVPFGVMLVLSTIIFIMIIFRRWPGLVSGIVAGCLTFISIYLLLLTLKEEVLVFE